MVQHCQRLKTLSKNQLTDILAQQKMEFKASTLIVDTIILFHTTNYINNSKERQINFPKKLHVGVMVIHPEKQ